MLENIEYLGHSSIKMLNDGKVIYIDPYQINENSMDADIILVTHSHYDHYSEEDIKKIKKEDTTIVIPKGMFQQVLKLGFLESNIVEVKPNASYQVKGIYFETVPSYNVNKSYHVKENEWVGYIIVRDNLRYYIAGDTDVTEESKKVFCDVAFLPVGGTYTMTASEAADLANEITPKIVVPIHYGVIVGSKEDAISFKSKINVGIDCYILF